MGQFVLEDIEPGPKGAAQIKVNFNLDANGILNVSAEDVVTKKTKAITITNDRGRLSKAEIEAMVKEAAKFEAQDAGKRKTVDARTRLEAYAMRLKNSIPKEVSILQSILFFTM